MKTYKVHVFTVVRVAFPGVEAGSQTDAIDKVRNGENFYSLFNRFHPYYREREDGIDIEWAEEDSHFLVDEEDDEEYENSMWYTMPSELFSSAMRGLQNDIFDMEVCDI